MSVTEVFIALLCCLQVPNGVQHYRVWKSELASRGIQHASLNMSRLLELPPNALHAVWRSLQGCNASQQALRGCSTALRDASDAWIVGLELFDITQAEQVVHWMRRVPGAATLQRMHISVFDESNACSDDDCSGSDTASTASEGEQEEEEQSTDLAALQQASLLQAIFTSSDVCTKLRCLQELSLHAQVSDCCHAPAWVTCSMHATGKACEATR